MHGLRKKFLFFTTVINITVVMLIIANILPVYTEYNVQYDKLITAQHTLNSEQVYSTLHKIDNLLENLAALYFITVILLCLSGIFVIDRLVVNPLKALSLYATNIAAHKPDTPLPTKRHDELGNLANSLLKLRNDYNIHIQNYAMETDKLNAELTQLQESNAYAKGVFNSVQNGLIITNGEGYIQAANPAICELLHYQQEELLGNTIYTLLPNSYDFRQQNKIIDFVLDNTKKKNGNMKFDIQTKSDHTTPVELSLSYLTASNKQYVIAVIHDIREQVQAERNLRYERDRAQSYLDTAEVAIVTIDSNSNISLVNRKCCELLGYSEAELLGFDFFSLCPDQESIAELRESYRQHVLTNEIFPKYFYITLLTSDGNERIFEWHNNTTKDFEWNTTGLILAGTDMTDIRKSNDERRALRDRLHQAQKMEAIGQLSSGIAHDFNNLLASIMGYTELLQDILPDTGIDSRHDYLREIYTSGERARDLVDGILKYSRGNASNDNNLALEALYLPAIEKDIVSMLRGILPESVDISISIPNDIQSLMISSINLQQIIINLSLNACDAMDSNGSLHITTSNILNHKGICASCCKSFTGNFVEISVIDNGKGIPTDAQTHLFEPFYTTKVIARVGNGSGMGLAVVHGLVHDANGHIVVNSKPGNGSTFSLFLPGAATQSVALEA